MFESFADLFPADWRPTIAGVDGAVPVVGMRGKA